MSSIHPHPRSALRNIPRVVFWPTWTNTVTSFYLVKLLRQRHHFLLAALKGVFFFLTHSFLYPLLKARLVPAFLLSTFILLNLFLWTYLPQVAFLALFHKGGSAWVNGTFLVLGESAAVVAILFECFLVDESQVDIFDAVLVHKGHDDLVRLSRHLCEDTVHDPVRRLGKPTKTAVYGPFSFRQIAEFVVLLPLNFMPYVGVPLFLLLTGYRAGPLQHWRYHQLLGLDRRQRHDFIKQRRWQYTWYGTAYLVLQLIPPLSMFFLMTAAVSSALWAAELETARKVLEDRTVQERQYEDEPEPA